MDLDLPDASDRGIVLTESGYMPQLQLQDIDLSPEIRVAPQNPHEFDPAEVEK